MTKNNFYDECYAFLSKVPKGKVTTYKALAQALNSEAYRAVGTAMKTNPNPIKIPCHRVILSSGKIGNYSVKGGVNKKISLLKQEGVETIKGKIDLYRFQHKF